MKIGLVIFLVILFSSDTSLAAIYKCEVKGTVMFSENPCGNESEEIDLTPPPVLKHNSHTSYGNSIKNMVGYVKINELNRDIEILQKRIHFLNQQKASDLYNIEKEVSAAQKQKMDKHQIKIAKQQAVLSINKKYKNKIYTAKRKIAQFKKEISQQLNSKVKNSGPIKQTKYANQNDINIDRFSKKQQYIDKIKQTEKTVKSYNRQLSKKISVIKKKQVSSQLNATNMMQLNVELDQIKRKYQSLISMQQAKIRHLQIKKQQVMDY
ncbi:DUF4124 domain-containing protein [Pseudoalteromonas denitrificans]|uniref:DUF4124 domain-containing protein n=1 Tax=Pseudoalteromonas denitrificans DSM 6059 TaxID=1123010 RepID=A0A1I1E083_9GAMM|nr:DUF4124 domain-containing protein [Pseudoalteromonas denitrificans]SFB80484.1 hypothetical protein SAMN02745724_00145 [Pseudoalteromonas denitrificans DSM 6059]